MLYHIQHISVIIATFDENTSKLLHSFSIRSSYQFLFFVFLHIIKNRIRHHINNHFPKHYLRSGLYLFPHEIRSIFIFGIISFHTVLFSLRLFYSILSFILFCVISLLQTMYRFHVAYTPHSASTSYQ
ncbi:uncharacterized protein TEOVI_000480300 [Trypanosoma equiperdum]|uniref:Uncharacterized protein n=1 Tax=Trypanosoma equiperdum TaxID=5694 RepID=A0A1G4I9E8_TRYEQ|nr:hypothetical protein, conserved [Trypanosoma equiperdum]